MSGSEPSRPALGLITNRRLSAAPLEVQVGKVLAAGASYVILREKDLSEQDLRALAGTLAKVAARCGRRLIVNSSLEVAAAVRAWGAQLPFETFWRLRADRRLKSFKIGVSVHSLREALAAEAFGADYVLAGHIFATECKAGVPGRGLDFLRRIRAGISIPLWAVGGIWPGNAHQAVRAGAEVVCVMSSLLAASDPEKLTGDYLRALARSFPGDGP